MEDIISITKAHYKKVLYPILFVLALVAVALIVIGIGAWLSGFFVWFGNLYAGMTFWQGAIATGQALAIGALGLAVFSFIVYGFMEL